MPPDPLELIISRWFPESELMFSTSQPMRCWRNIVTGVTSPAATRQ
ncbi:hypothetical protein KCP74_20375 [Salmonella enterica subsp. enterica]|nr:hypothetical protein KCP74_20375 [Salmonella enterica subsp. enterica]